MNIVVLSGGTSNERAVSVRSGKAVVSALKRAGYKVHYYDIADSNFNMGHAIEDANLVIPMLHGSGGEDGSLQANLEELGAPYFGSSAQACKDSFNKICCKEKLAEHGVLTPAWQIVNETEFMTAGLRESSYVLKPIEGGSSIDMLIVRNPDHQPEPDVIKSLFQKHDELMLEEHINGREVTVGVLGDEALPVIEIIPPFGEEFDYENKYNGRTQEITNPLSISSDVQTQLKQTALQVHRIIGCKDISRTDMIIAENGAVYVLEINTLPGMTDQSLVPKAALADGLSMVDLVRRMVELGISK